MNFVFENLDTFENFISCPDVNPSGTRRFNTSPAFLSMLTLSTKRPDFTSVHLDYDPNKFDSYIIASGVAHSPEDWLHHSKTNLFSFLNPTYLKDLQSGKAFLMLDQTHEGYHVDWIFDELHINCQAYSINPKQIIYITGNLDVRRQYNKWCLNKFIEGRLFVIGFAHFESIIHLHGKKYNLPLFDDHVAYKTANINKIKTYNCLQKRPRVHRAWMFKLLLEHGLLDSGHNSMNPIRFEDTYYDGKTMSVDEYNSIDRLLPMLPPTTENSNKEVDIFADHNSGKYQLRMNDDIMLDSWVSVISEALFAEPTCFISEKSFKPIICSHPFIIFGNKNSLKHLHEMGYKTFHPYINERYDSLDTWERMDAIIDALKEINQMTADEKLKWFVGLGDILNYNKALFNSRVEQEIPKQFIKIKEHVKG